MRSASLPSIDSLCTGILAASSRVLNIPSLRSLVAVAVLVLNTASAATPAERYVVITNGVEVGHMRVTRSGAHIAVDYRVDDNGRGPKIKEAIDLRDDGLPYRWSIRGNAESGSPVRERFVWRSGLAQWRTESDSGQASTTQPHLYLANDPSPYSLALYVAALKDVPGMTLPVWPKGEIRAQKVRDLKFGSSPDAITVWALWGLGLEPVLVMTDPRMRFIGWLDSGRLVVPSHWSGDTAELQSLSASINTSMLHDVMARAVHRWQAPVYLRNVRVLDPASGTLSELTSVVTFNGRITGVHATQSPPDDAVVIEGEGATVVPGLFDMHGHLSAWQGPLYLAAGIATVRDMGNDNAELSKLVGEYEAGELLGPRVIRAGFLEGRSPYSANGGFVVDSLADALEKVRWYADRGYWGIKIYNSIRPEWVESIAAQAHRLGLRVVGHVPAFMSSREAIRAGYDEVTHLNQLLLSLLIDPQQDDTRTVFRFTALGERAGSLDLHSEEFQDLLGEMRLRGTALDPTVAILSHMLLARPGSATPVTAAWLEHLPAPIERRGRAAFLDIRPGQDGNYRKAEARLLEATKLLHESGIQLLPGTDYSPGFMLVSELEAWQRAGISPADIVRLATLGAARYLGLDRELGTIERGKRADLLLVSGDPTKDVGALRRVRMVMKDGAVVFPEEIYAALQVKPFARWRTALPDGGQASVP